MYKWVHVSTAVVSNMYLSNDITIPERQYIIIIRDRREVTQLCPIFKQQEAPFEFKVAEVVPTLLPKTLTIAHAYQDRLNEVCLQ
jgi:hypothetical protein